MPVSFKQRDPGSIGHTGKNLVWKFCLAREGFVVIDAMLVVAPVVICKKHI